MSRPWDWGAPVDPDRATGGDCLQRPRLGVDGHLPGEPIVGVGGKSLGVGVSEQGAIRHQGALAYGELAIANGLAAVVANQNQTGIG